ncbi:MAG: hypothetical protein C3F07_17040 [Anaerolineales bacterium]|nr:hypothetical protein [Anaerolineae bacterium]PWB70416.1 MAG: hypothetical protein C3F07_17040 [Anaerolineales bacterium]
MSQPASNQSETSKMKRLLKGETGVTAPAQRVKRSGGGAQTPPPQQPAAPVESTSEPSGEKPSRYRFLPAFWTVSSIISMAMNVVLIVILLTVLQMLGAIQLTANDQFSGLLGGLYNNFVRMDEASIVRDVSVNTTVPLNITVPVKTTTQITLAQDVVIPNAHVRINSGNLIIDDNAAVTLPANTPLTINLDFQLTVQDNIPINITVPVNIPLNETQLHEPFVGLQKVVEPYYCLVEPNAVVNGVNICSPIADLQNPTGPVTP